MKMHSSKFRDPLISLPHPVTLITPVVEETLRIAGLTATKEQVLDRFMSGHPRIAVVHSSDDHPPAWGTRDSVRRTIRQIWINGGIPFDVASMVPCEELTHGHQGQHYALLARNLCAAALASQMEAQGYDAAIIVGVCDKMLVGNLRALIEADVIRQRRRSKPVFAAFIPASICRENFVHDEDRRRFDPLRSRLTDESRQTLDGLLRRALRPQVYAELRAFLEGCFDRRLIQEIEKDDLEHLLAKLTASLGANCSASQTSLIHRLIVAAMGLVPRHLDVSARAPSEEQLGEVVRRLMQAIQKRERRVSVWNLVRINLSNAVAVWSATGAYPVWLIHFSYLADAVGKKLGFADMLKTASTVPQILALDESNGHSPYAMAVEAEVGGNSGVDTIMRTLSERRMIEDRCTTLDGTWSQRITDARSANGNFLYSTMNPVAPACRVTGPKGNFFTTAVARLGSEPVNGLSAARRVYFVVSYLGLRELELDLAKPQGVLDRLKSKLSAEDLRRNLRVNYRDHEDPPRLEDWSKNRLWQYLADSHRLHVVVSVAGLGPHASGMPEVACDVGMDFLLLTDGRVSFQHRGLAVSHIVPEALDSGGIVALRTGDCVQWSADKGELNLVEVSRKNTIRVLTAKEIRSRPEVRKRVHELERRQADLLPSVRALFGRVSAADAGVSPAF